MIVEKRNNKYLVIDDDEVDRMLLRRVLSDADSSGEIAEADCAEAAMEVLNGLVFDCIFMDYRLPKTDGLQLLKMVRSKGIKSPVVMMTGMGDERLAVELMQAGASDYLAKSRITVDTVSHALQNIRRLHHAEEARSLAEEALRENQRTLSTLMSNLPGMAYRSRPDKGRTIEFASEGCQNLTGFDSESYLSANIIYTNIIHPEDRERVSTVIFNALEAGRRFQTTYRIFSRQGSVKWVWEQGCGVYTHRGDLIAIEGFVTDISERIEIEEEIKKKNNELEQIMDNLEGMVAERTSDLERANEKLKRLNQIKSEFLSVVSHELRTPLTSIKSFAEILLDDIEKMDMETVRDYLGIIDAETDRLARLIANLLDLQKIDAGKMSWNDGLVDVAKLVEASVDVFRAVFQEKGIELHIKKMIDQTFCWLDPDKLQQVISNLLSNALKFTVEGGVVIKIDLDSDVGNVILSVEDTGVGIPEDELEKVFDRFYQVDDSQSRQFSGTGLGLGICKEIIEHYQGRIWAERGQERGTVMSISLPVASENSDTKPADLKVLA